MASKVARAFTAVVSIGAIGCASDGGADVSRVVRRDSAGVAIVESLRDGWSGASNAWTVDTTATIEIGAADGEAPYLLARIAGATRLPDGRIVVADGGSNELRFFDSTGAFLRAVGRQGKGPGEFEYVRALERCGADSLFAFDLNWQLKVFTADGALARETVPREPNGRVGPYQLACSPNGVFVISGWGDIRGQHRIGLYRAMTNVWILDPAGRELADLGEHLGSERLGTANGSGPHPFGRSTVFAAGREEIYLGDGERFEVRRHGHDGRLVRIQRAQAEDLSIGAALLDAYREERVARASASRRPMVERQVREMPLPSGLPAYTSMKVDAAGYLWVERFRVPGESRRRWGVFAPDGEFLGHVPMPERFDVMEVGADYVLGVTKDAEDVERVRLHPLRRGR